jgi:anthranilate synthase/aminodeoxychorismate synthase-like glutamine amidotransferase
MLLLLDNFDSFVYNLARYFEELGHETLVVRNDAIDITGVRSLQPSAIVISPGPCDPARAGVSLDIVRELGAEVPILGVCLGHQVVGAAYGAEVIRGQPVHGRAAAIHHDGRGIFRDIPNPFTAARYHSLILSPDELPASLEVAARLDDGTIMAVRHRNFPVVGVQFHPESVLTEHGPQFLLNFLMHETDRKIAPGTSQLARSTAASS